jgi:hypothetical protein
MYLGNPDKGGRMVGGWTRGLLVNFQHRYTPSQWTCQRQVTKNEINSNGVKDLSFSFTSASWTILATPDYVIRHICEKLMRSICVSL